MSNTFIINRHDDDGGTSLFISIDGDNVIIYDNGNIAQLHCYSISDFEYHYCHRGTPEVIYVSN